MGFLCPLGVQTLDIVQHIHGRPLLQVSGPQWPGHHRPAVSRASSVTTTTTTNHLLVQPIHKCTLSRECLCVPHSLSWNAVLGASTVPSRHLSGQPKPPQIDFDPVSTQSDLGICPGTLMQKQWGAASAASGLVITRS